MRACHAGLPTGAETPFPVAWRMTVSFVEVSPSTVTALKVASTVASRSPWSASAGASTSVTKKANMVAMLGWIIPEPFAKPATLTSSMVLPESLSVVSVVRMAAAARSVRSPRAHEAEEIARSTGAIGKGTPMTPVEHTSTSSIGQSSALATA